MRYFDNKTCTSKCRSVKHALDLISLITKTNDTQTLLSAFIQCYNCHKTHDEFGRYLLYMAASCGRSEAVDWLVKFKKAELQVKNSESGWTPAHAAAFHGHIDSLITLIKLGANLNKTDHDTLNVIEHLSLDKWISSPYTPDLLDDFDIYSWGSNTNFNLGNGSEMKKNYAEVVEFFKKLDTSVIQIVMSKFHTVFLTRNGQVYTCGFGIDGRLGHGDEEILMAPKLIDNLKNFKCVQVAASRNNTYFLTSEGVVYSCGTNQFKQLGHIGAVSKSLLPKSVNLGKRLKGKAIKQIECSRFHIVMLTSSSEVYTYGLNAGQIGHPNETVENATNYNNQICYILEPRLITQLNEPDLKIDLIACSDGVTVALQRSKNILYIFNDYKCKRLYYIKETNSQLKKIRVHGGKLDNQVNPELKWIEDLGDPLVIVGLTESNLIYIWRENDPVWRKISWSPNKKLLVADFDLNVQGLILCTLQGACYKAQFQKSKLQKNDGSPPGFETVKYNSNQATDPKIETLELTQVPYVNRCFQVVCDRKARNYFCLQYHPNSGMRYYPIRQDTVFFEDMENFLNENVHQQKSGFGYSNIEPQFHDIELKYRNHVFCCNKFVLLSRSSKFFLKLDLKSSNQLIQIDLDSLLTQKFNLQLFELLLRYLYTGKFYLSFNKQCIKAAKINSETSFQKFLADFKELAVDKFGFTELKTVFDSNAYTRNLKDLNINSKSNDERHELMADFMYKLVKTASTLKNKSVKFNRFSYQDLYDCEIECNNQQSIKCHRCILIARSDYFKNMMMGYWMESSKYAIQLPFDADLMQILVDYFYSDEIQMDFIHTNQSNTIKSKTEREIEILFNLYILSDQLLVERVKNLCEFNLSNLVNLKNVVEIFEFSNQYEAKQLKEFCMEFISCNLATIVEAKQLESTSVDLLQELSEFYRNYYPLIGSRRITPYSSEIGLDPKNIDLIPLDLLYDQKFIDGFIDDESINKKKLNQIQNKSETNEIEFAHKNIAEEPKSPISNKEEAELPIVAVPAEKWEKVRKKNRRKISESQQLVNQQASPVVIKNNNVSPRQVIAASPVLQKADSPVQATVPVPEVKKPNEFDFNWPSLNDNLDSKKTIESIQKKFPKKMTQKLPITPMPREQPKENSPIPVPAWKSEIQTPKHSLLDLMNEDMTKLVVNSPPPAPIEPIQFVANNSSFNASKGWNISHQASNVKTNSITQIIEMEKKTKEQYFKLKSRPLNLIQLEEAAIEDLKKVYNVDNLTHMNIKIEIIDSENINCAPVWKH